MQSSVKTEIDAFRDLLKARDISKLTKKKITTKRGHQMTVYVRTGEAKAGHKEHGGEKESVKDGLEQFRELALKHNLTDSFDKTTQIKGVSSAVSQAFKKKYDPDNNLTPKRTWEKFYDEVNAAAPKPGEYGNKNGVQLKVNQDGSSESKYGKYGPKGTKELIKEHGLTHQGEAKKESGKDVKDIKGNPKDQAIFSVKKPDAWTTPYLKQIVATGKVPGGSGNTVSDADMKAAKDELAKRSGKKGNDIPGGSYHVSKHGHVHGHSKVEGKKVEIDPKLHTFIHREKGERYQRGEVTKNPFVITEASTGLQMAFGKTEQEAVEKAKQEVARLGLDKIQQRIHAHKSEEGAMPGHEEGGKYKTTAAHEPENKYRMGSEKSREATWNKLHADKQLIRGTDIKDGYKDAKAWHDSVKANPSLWTDSVISAKRFKADFIKRGPNMANQRMADAVYWSGVEKVARETGTWDEPAKAQQDFKGTGQKGDKEAPFDAKNPPGILKVLSEASDLMKLPLESREEQEVKQQTAAVKKLISEGAADPTHNKHDEYKRELRALRFQVESHNKIRSNKTMKAQNQEIEGLRLLLKARPLRKADDVKEAEPTPKQGDALRDCDKSFIKALGTVAGALSQRVKDQLNGLVTYDLRWCTNAQDIMNKVDTAVMFETGAEIEAKQRAVLLAAANEIVRQNAVARNNKDISRIESEKTLVVPTLAKAATVDWRRQLQMVDRVTL